MRRLTFLLLMVSRARPAAAGAGRFHRRRQVVRVFKDEKLQDLVRRALQRNYDLRDAVPRVEEARASLGITRSNQYPNFGAGASVEINRLSRGGSTPIPPELLPSQNRNFGSGGAGVAVV